MIIRCECGREIKNINELKNVHSVGLALKGQCPRCERQINANQLWTKTKEIKKNDK